MAYWLAIIILLGFSPFVIGSGYYGSYHFKKFLNPEKITYFREIVYTTQSPLNSQTVASPQSPVPQSPSPQPVNPSPDMPSLSPPSKPDSQLPSLPQPQPENSKVFEGSGSTFVLETGLNKGPITFLKNSFQSFLYSLLGPLPWQFNNPKQAVALAETIPWYFMIIMFCYLSFRFIAQNGFSEFWKLYKTGFPLLFFSVLALGALSLFINNYGIIARIRIPMFVCLVSLMCVIFNSILETYYANISSYWRSWVYRFPLGAILKGGRRTGDNY